MSGKNKKKFETCPNCNYRFAEVNNYCANCGQENHDLNMPFGHVVLEVLEGTFHFDTKIFRTLKLLLFKPGRLTAEFIQNKRAPYVPPIRLYVFVSFIFFLVLAADVMHKGEKAEEDVRLPEKMVVAEGVSLSRQEAGLHGPVAFDLGGLNSEVLKNLPHAPDAQLDKMIQQNNLEPTAFKRAAFRKAGKFLSADKDVQTHKFLKMLSVLMFLLMPLFALIMKSAYIRHKVNYIQFLIVALHYHCFVFLVLSLGFLLEAFLQWDGFIMLALLVSFIYLVLEQRYLFKQRFGKALVKTFYVAGFYGFNLAVFMFLAAVLSIAFS